MLLSANWDLLLLSMPLRLLSAALHLHLSNVCWVPGINVIEASKQYTVNGVWLWATAQGDEGRGRERQRDKTA